MQAMAGRTILNSLLCRIDPRSSVKLGKGSCCCLSCWGIKKKNRRWVVAGGLGAENARAESASGDRACEIYRWGHNFADWNPE